MQRAHRPRAVHLENLANAIVYPGEKQSVFGVILDATGHYKTNDSINYVTRLRIFDHSLNFSERNLPKDIKNFIYVFIYSDTVGSAPQVGRIGDVILLQNFHFDFYGKTGKAIFHKKNSSWVIFDGRKNANILQIMSSQKDKKVLSEKEKRDLHSLRVWAECFFQRKSLYSMAWFKRSIPKSKKKEDVWALEDVDIIAKLLADVSVKKDDQFYQRMVFIDKEKRIYLAEHKGLLTGVDRGDVLKLRSIGIVMHNDEFKINFSSYSNFMVLQKHFKDAKEILEVTKNAKYDQKKLRKEFFQELHLDKRSKAMIGPNTFIYTTKAKQQDPKASQKNLEIIFPILKNFCYDVKEVDSSYFPKRKPKSKKQGIGSAVLWKHSNLPITPLKELEAILNARSSQKKPKDVKEEFYKVRANIVSIENLDFESNFKIFSPSKNKTWKVRPLIKKLAGDAKVIFYNVFGLRDSSLGKKTPPLHGYLITYNENPKYIYDLWRLLPDPLVVKDWLNVDEARKQKFEKCLTDLQTQRQQFELVLQIVKAEKKTYLKVVDSIFWISNQ